jgi:uncharacterized protein YodC (DUF2158 family)
MKADPAMVCIQIIIIMVKTKWYNRYSMQFLSAWREEENVAIVPFLFKEDLHCT